MPRQNHKGWIRATAIFSFVFSLTAGLAVAQEIPYEVKVNYSLAAENYKNEDYESALPYLRWLIVNAPTVYNGERIHRRMVNTYAALAEAAEDDSTRIAYLDSALMVLRTAPTTLKDADAPYNEARWELDYGNFVDRYSLPGVDEEPVDHWLKAYELDPAGLDPYYVRKIVDDFVRLQMIDEATEFMEDAEQHYAEDPELMMFFDEMRDELFRSPEERIAFLLEQLEKEPDNGEIIRELFGIYGALGMAAEQEEMGARLLELDPSVDTFIEVAEIKYEDANYEGALELYARALEMADESERKRDIEYTMAQANYDMGRLQSARTHARNALSHDRSFGEAYFLIGDILVKAVQDSEFEREDRAVYWLAMDYWERAASVDPSLRSRASRKVQQFRQYMPTTEDKFFKGWNEGDEYRIDYGSYAWVNETTRVR